MDGSLVCGGLVGEDDGSLVCGRSEGGLDGSLVRRGTTDNMVGLDDDGWELGLDDGCIVGN